MSRPSLWKDRILGGLTPTTRLMPNVKGQAKDSEGRKPFVSNEYLFMSMVVLFAEIKYFSKTLKL